MSENINDIITNDELDEMLNISNIEIKSDKESLKLYADDSEYTLSLRVTEIENEKELSKFIRSVENIVRKAPEYKLWTDYIHQVLRQQKCEITGELLYQTRVEIHHHPYTLYEIVKALILQKSTSQKEFCSFDIAYETIKLHFEMKIGYCLLVKSLHEKYHNAFLPLPMDLVKGNYLEFHKEYFGFLDEDDQTRILERLNITKANCGWKIKWIEASKGE